MGVQLLRLLGLGCHSEQASDEGDLASDVSLAHPLHLSFPHHVHHFIALECSPRGFKRKEAHCWLDTPFDKAMILLDEIICQRPRNFGSSWFLVKH
jgi:hypothetical protein